VSIVGWSVRHLQLVGEWLFEKISALCVLCVIIFRCVLIISEMYLHCACFFFIVVHDMLVNSFIVYHFY
jgi:hypothetical protein